MAEKFIGTYYKNMDELKEDAVRAKKILEEAGARQEDIEELVNDLNDSYNEEVIWTVANNPKKVEYWKENVGFDDEYKFMNFTMLCTTD